MSWRFSLGILYHLDVIAFKCLQNTKEISLQAFIWLKQAPARYTQNYFPRRQAYHDFSQRESVFYLT